jgi:MFS family permease
MTKPSRNLAVAATGATPTLPLKAVIAVVAGNWLEFYDFLVYTFFAVMIGDAFFPAESQIGRLLGALATFGVGFITRPLGAAIIGPYADRVGRRAALTLTLLLMSLGSAIVGLTPPYSQIGIAAPILLLVARLIQGFSCGGEVGPATTYLLESAPMNKRAALTAWQAYSQQLAAIMGSGFGVILAVTLSKDQLYAWGWRVPFILGIFIAPLGLYIRRQLPETIAENQTHRSTMAVLGELLRHHSRAVVLIIIILSGGTISTYVFNYMTTYAITTLHLSSAIATTLTLTGSVAQLAGFAMGVWMDRFGRKRMLVAERVVFLILIYPVYLIITSLQASVGHCCRQCVHQLHFCDRRRQRLRVPFRSVPAVGAVERSCDPVRIGRRHIRRHHTVRDCLAHRRDEESNGAGVVSDRVQHPFPNRYCSAGGSPGGDA